MEILIYLGGTYGLNGQNCHFISCWK